MAQRIEVFSRSLSSETTQLEQVAHIAAAEEHVLYLIAKRAFDVVLATALLVLLLPLFLVVAVAIWLDSPGPIILRQKRIGRDGRAFGFFKFRSMHQNVDCEAHREFARQYISGNYPGPCEATNPDQPIFKAPPAQITRVGKFLRRTSIDELPQLINILKGDMTLVGPRPSIYYELEAYKPWHRRRLEVLPGLTGWAQIHGRSSLRFDDIVTLDLEYIRARSLAMDLKIMARTIPVVLSGKGAG